MRDDLRRVPRVSVCCRAVVHDPYGVWSAVTEDVCARGCRIVTARLLRRGTSLVVTLSSDLFPEELETAAHAAWATPEILGVAFVRTSARPGALSPEAWIEKVIEHGTTAGTSRSRIVPAVMRPGSRATRLARGTATILQLPLRRP